MYLWPRVSERMSYEQSFFPPNLAYFPHDRQNPTTFLNLTQFKKRDTKILKILKYCRTIRCQLDSAMNSWNIRLPKSFFVLLFHMICNTLNFSDFEGMFLTLFGLRGDTLLLVLFGSDFVSWIFIKNFQTVLLVKIDINLVHFKPCQAHWVL